jgi:hypothetical protein
VKTLAVFCLLAVLAPAVAGAEMAWRLPPEQLAATLRTPQSYQYQPPSLVTGPADAATALLSRSESPALLSLDRNPGGGWSPLTVPSGAAPLDVALAGGAGSGSTQTAVWLENGSCGCGSTAFAARRQVGEPWQPAVELPRFGGSEDQIGSAPAVAQDGAGDALVVWIEAHSGFSPEWLVASEWHNGAWSSPQQISAPTPYIFSSEQIAVASDGPGEFVVGWREEASAGLYQTMAETLGTGGWSGEQVVESSPDWGYGVAVSANASGHAGMVWVDSETDTIHAASLQSGVWTVSNPAGTDIHAACVNAQPQVAVDAAGASLALWLESDGRLTSETMAAGGGWLGDRATVAKLDPNAFSQMGLAVDGGGAALASWTTTELESPWPKTLGASARTAGGAWGAPVTLASDTNGFDYIGPATAIAADGSGLVGWMDSLAVPGSNEQEWDDTPRAAVFAPAGAQAPAGTQAPAVLAPGSNPPKASPARRRLGSVYVRVPKHRLWLARHGHTVTAAIRNTNPFPVTGTARIYEYLLPRNKRAHASSLAVAALVHYRLAAHQTKPISFRIGRRALRRLHALVPDRGHILVSVRLSIDGEGQAARSAIVMALDQPLAPHRGRLHRPRVPAGYRAPVDPWARKAC